MREAGFEPANPKDVGLSDVALTTNRFAQNGVVTFLLLSSHSEKQQKVTFTSCCIYSFQK